MRFWQLGLIVAVATVYAYLYVSYTSSDFEAGLQKLMELTNLDIKRELKIETGQLLADDYENIIIVPDIHGDAGAFLRSLWIGVMNVDSIPVSYDKFRDMMLAAAEAGVFPPKPISNKKSLFIQLGDVVDRGPHSVLCLRILWSVERVIGWPVMPLYGNHEIMSSQGVRPEYIHKDDLASFGGMQNRYREFGSGRPLWDMIIRINFGMIQLDSVSESKRTLFVHAGIEPVWHERVNRPSILEFNSNLRQALSSKVPNRDQIGDLVNNLESPVWSRLFSEGSDEELCDVVLPDIQTHMNVHRIIIGHSPQDDHKMKSRCDGKIILADCAMSSWMYDDSGQPALLVLTNSPGNDWASISVHYFDDSRSSSTIETPEVMRIVSPKSPRGVEEHATKFIEPEYPVTLRKLFIQSENHQVHRATFRNPKKDKMSPYYDGVVDIQVDRDIDELLSIFRAYTDSDERPENVRIVDVAHIMMDSTPAPYVLFSVPSSSIIMSKGTDFGEDIMLAVAETISGLHVIGVTLNAESCAEILSMFALDTKTRTVHLISLGKAEFNRNSLDDTIVHKRRHELSLVSSILEGSKKVE
jgi:hypothetical protein